MYKASIHLSDLRFFAYHGLYKEEQVLGNEFAINIEVGFTPAEFPIVHIADTINYALVYELVKKRMQIATPLIRKPLHLILPMKFWHSFLYLTMYIFQSIS
jgi:dihydroneopterin aldolase